MGKKKNQEKQPEQITTMQAMDYIDSLAPGLMAYIVKDKWSDFTIALKIIREDIIKNLPKKKDEAKK